MFNFIDYSNTLLNYEKKKKYSYTWILLTEGLLISLSCLSNPKSPSFDITCASFTLKLPAKHKHKTTIMRICSKSIITPIRSQYVWVFFFFRKNICMNLNALYKILKILKILLSKFFLLIFNLFPYKTHYLLRKIKAYFSK